MSSSCHTRVCNSGGESFTSSATKASLTAALPRMLICLVAVKIRSLSALHVGQVLASGREVGGSSQEPVSTAYRHHRHGECVPLPCSAASASCGASVLWHMLLAILVKHEAQLRLPYHARMHVTELTRSQDASCSGSCGSLSFFFLPAFFGGILPRAP